MAKRGNNQARSIVTIGVIIALVVTSAFLLGLVKIDDGGPSMQITFYDIEGNEIGTTTGSVLTPLYLQQEGFDVEIYSLRVVVYFTVTTDIAYDHVNTACWLSVTVTPQAYGASPVHEIAEHRLGEYNVDLEGSFYRSINDGHYYMTELFPNSAITDAAKVDGWAMRFDARIETTVTYEEGGIPTAKVAEDTCYSVLLLEWNEGEVAVNGWFGDIP